MKIELSTAECRFGQVGDWPTYEDIRCVPLGNWQYEALVLLHELVEALDCKRRGVSAEAVDEFDKDFSGEGEPGDDANCPYRSSHQLATVVEMLVAHNWGISFPDYYRITTHLGELHAKKT